MAELDPSIALHGLLINRNDENLKQAEYQQRMQTIQQGQQQQDNQRRLADLLPQAANGNQNAIDRLYAVDPQIALKMDDRQREAAQAHVADLSAAVRWADTPEKWAYVQQHYAQETGQDLSQYPFQARERALVALGQMGEYLKSAPSNQGTSLQRNYEFLKTQNPQLADRYLQGQTLGSPTVVDNGDGTKTIYPPGYFSGAPQGGGNVPQGAIDMLKSNPSLAPQFDQKYGNGASQRVLGGQTGYAPSGGF